LVRAPGAGRKKEVYERPVTNATLSDGASRLAGRLLGIAAYACAIIVECIWDTSLTGP